MSEVEEKGNRILAYFMGVEYSTDLNYHEDWNKLMPLWRKLYEDVKWKYHPVDEHGNRVRLNSIENAILVVDIRQAWGLITGLINKHILTEEEYLKFK